MREKELSAVTKDFIFRTLATDELRLEDIRRRFRGSVTVEESPRSTRSQETTCASR
jgi:hypothetical protein